VFQDANHVRILIPDSPEHTLSADIILVATGTRPAHPPQYQFDHVHVYDSDSILMLDRVPRSLAILGGGVAGCEYASIFAALGVQVAIIDSKERLLPWLDAELSLGMEELFRAASIELYQQVRAMKVEAGERDVLVNLSDGRRVIAEKVLVAAGRLGNTDRLNLAAAGIKASDRGIVEVNEHYQTATPHIYAAGDVVGFPGLASASMEQARVAMTHACGRSYKQKLTDLLPFGIYTIPEVSSVGETEESLRAKKIPYVVGKASLVENARANLVGEAVGFLKIIASSDGARILGVHCIGPHASELVHHGQAVMSLGGTLGYFIEAVFNYPTLGEAYKHAAYDALDRIRELQEPVTRLDSARSS
jgi:NAD(P) transhydrogenase